MIDLDGIPEDCTSKDTQVLRKANHEFAQQYHKLLDQVEQLKALLAECKDRFYEYENDVEYEKHYSHIKFMRKIESALSS